MNLTAFTLSSAALMIHHYAEFYRKRDLHKTLEELEPDLGIPRITTFDYIVVGGGTAGCLIATRLSEVFNVLLLEKGGDPVPQVQPLVFIDDYDHHSEINDKYLLMPQENFGLETPGGKLYTPVGKMLGGSGSHNLNIYNRGHPLDYDKWANITGDPSWCYENVLEHYKRIENFVGTLVKEDERYKYYGLGGPLQITTGNNPHLPTWFKAGTELGYAIADPNGHQVPSFTAMHVSMRNGVRDSSYTAYLKQAEGRRTLTVLRYSEVDKILFDGKRAYGVAYKRHGVPQIAHARKEIILSAGVFASPIILIKSGIGPRELLQSAGISEVANLPGVGKGIQDHPHVDLNYTSQNHLQPIDDIQIQAELNKFHFHKRHGLFSQFPQAQAFITSTAAKEGGEGNWPDISICSRIYPFEPSKHQLLIFLGRPKTFGEIYFNVTAFTNGERDTVKLARPDFKFFKEEADLKVMIEAMRIGTKIFEETEAFRSLNVRFTDTTPKACEGLVPKSDAFWTCYIRQRSTRGVHNIGGCRMGDINDQMAVVDSKLRLRGVKGIRVVDGSVIPTIANANVNAAVLVIAEKAATDILQGGGIHTQK